MTKAKTKATNLQSKREPTADERKAIALANERRKQRRKPVAVALVDDGKGGRSLEAPHADQDGFLYQLADVFATRSHAFVGTQLEALEWMTRKRSGEPTQGFSGPINAGLALIDAVRPENELEAGLAIQMAGTHALACELLGRAKVTDRTDHMQLYGNLAVKLSRTFTAQIETLGKMRRGGEQIVRHIHVDNRGGQAVIAENVTTGGQENEKIDDQCRATVGAGIGPALLSSDPSGNGVPIPSRERAEAVPNARGDESGGTRG